MPVEDIVLIVAEDLVVVSLLSLWYSVKVGPHQRVQVLLWGGSLGGQGWLQLCRQCSHTCFGLSLFTACARALCRKVIWCVMPCCAALCWAALQTLTPRP